MGSTIQSTINETTERDETTRKSLGHQKPPRPKLFVALRIDAERYCASKLFSGSLRSRRVGKFVLQALLEASAQDFAFPYDYNPPSQRLQILQVFDVAFRVLSEPLLPKLHVRRRGRAFSASRVPVPKAAVHEYHGLALGHDYVRPSREILPVQPESETMPVQPRPNRLLRFGILGGDSRHKPASSFLRQAIHDITLIEIASDRLLGCLMIILLESAEKLA